MARRSRPLKTRSKNGAMVLLSGGQDSTTCLYWALSELTLDPIRAIAFDYAQRHRVEIECAQRIADDAAVPLEIINLQGVFAGSALVDFTQNPSAQHDIDPDLPATFTAGRNAVFLSIAAGRAYQHGMSNLVIGACETDHNDYPDCRRNFMDSMESTLSLALQTHIRIHTPLMNLSKAEIWKLAQDLGCLEVIINGTHTDYNGDRTTLNPWGYGKTDNPASILRAEGYNEAKMKGWV